MNYSAEDVCPNLTGLAQVRGSQLIQAGGDDFYVFFVWKHSRRVKIANLKGILEMTGAQIELQFAAIREQQGSRIIGEPSAGFEFAEILRC